MDSHHEPKPVVEPNDVWFEAEWLEGLNRAMLDTALDGIIAMNSAGTVLEFNPAAERIFGYRRDEAVGRELAQLVIPERLRERHRRGLAHYLQTGEGPVLGRRIEIDALRSDGTEILVELAITALRVDDVPFFVAYLRDITERIRGERRRTAQYAVASLLSGSQSLTEIGPKIIETIASSGAWALGAIWLQNEGDENLSCHAIWHLPEPAMQEFAKVTEDTRFLMGVGLPGRVWTAKKALWVQDVAADSQFLRAEAAARAGLHGAFAFPLTARNVVKGVLEMYSPQLLKPDDDLLQLVESLGTQIGLFIYRRWIEEQMGMSV